MRRVIHLCVVVFWSASSAWASSDWPSAVYVMRSAGAQPRKIAQVEGYAEHTSPRWSHDGKRIVFDAFSTNARVRDVFVVNADGSGLEKIADRAEHPNWSPDDQQIVYNTHSQGPKKVFVQNIDGGGRTEITDGFSPRWSPDGSQLAIERDDNLYLVDLVSGESKPLFEQPHEHIHHGFSWSRDGKRLALVVSPAGAPLRDLLIVDTTGEKPKVTKRLKGGMGGYVSFSPDGKQMVYGDSYKIRLLETEGTNNAQPMPDQKGHSYHPDWSPDGAWIVFISDRHAPKP